MLWKEALQSLAEEQFTGIVPINMFSQPLIVEKPAATKRLIKEYFLIFSGIESDF